ncbi:MAG: pseudouridine synthase [Candidatus Aminicenantes bacterium]|nr:pseudouridine synthase [Candidatus Aminicenantes bacterium]
MQIRLNKFLSQAGIASRREVDKMITEGRVKVNGQVVKVLGSKIDDEKDRVEVDGRRVDKEEGMVYLMLNKPPGYLVTLRDNFKRPTIEKLLPSLRQRIFPVGRLDYDSSGLLLMMNDGELAYRLTHPRFKVPKVYLAKVMGEPDSSDLARIEKGIYLDGKKTAPAKVAQIKSDPKKSLFKIEIFEGRKREVKRMFKAVGHKVLHLQRIGFGSLRLGTLKAGKWRYLTKKEIGTLKKLSALKQ